MSMKSIIDIKKYKFQNIKNGKSWTLTRRGKKKKVAGCSKVPKRTS